MTEETQIEEQIPAAESDPQIEQPQEEVVNESLTTEEAQIEESVPADPVPAAEQTQEPAPEQPPAPSPADQTATQETQPTTEATPVAQAPIARLVCVIPFNELDHEYLPGEDVLPGAHWPEGTLERRLQYGYVKFVAA